MAANALPRRATLWPLSTDYELVVRGLERVGDEPAVEVLLSALAANYGDIAVLARRALKRMQERISNPNLKETVKRELEKEPAKGPSSQQ